MKGLAKKMEGWCFLGQADIPMIYVYIYISECKYCAVRGTGSESEGVCELGSRAYL